MKIFSTSWKLAGEGTGSVFGKRPNVLTRLLSENRPLVMGVLNVTPDSFSDGGQFTDPEDALQQAQKMIEAGADIIDIGAESTRPYGGQKPVTLEEELTRLQPVLGPVIEMAVLVEMIVLALSIRMPWLEARIVPLSMIEPLIVLPAI